MPAVSIIVPVYNRAQYLEECIDSILSQNVRDFELILIDDGSRDESPKICDRYALQDTRVRVVHQKNMGVSAARNAGLEVACGQYVMFVDSDDTITAEMLESLLPKKCVYDLVISGFERVYADRRVPSVPKQAFCGGRAQFEKEVFTDCYDKYLLHGPCNKLFLRALIAQYAIRFPTELSIYEDFVFVLHYLEYAETMCVVDATHYYYRQMTEGSLVKTIPANYYDVTRTLLGGMQRYIDTAHALSNGEVQRLRVDVCQRVFGALAHFVCRERGIPQVLRDAVADCQFLAFLRVTACSSAVFRFKKWCILHGKVHMFAAAYRLERALSGKRKVR